MLVNRKLRLLALVLAAASLSFSCAQKFFRVSYSCHDADTRLHEVWIALQDARSEATCDMMPNGLDRCENLRLDIERIAQDCPTDVEALMVNAVLAYDEKQFVKAQQLLDSLFSLRTVHPEAAVLRARLALDEGNVPFATRYLEEQIQLSPDHAGLRELYAAALYSVGRFDEARSSLTAAEQLGAPKWRIAYSRGLIEEAAGQTEKARGYYQDALRDRPGWKPAESRLRGLSATRRPGR